MGDYTLAEFAEETADLLKRGGVDELARIAQNLRRLLASRAFVAETFDEATPYGKRVIHHDPETGFYILAHVQEPTGKAGAPHTHGSSWAIYGNAKGGTEMTIWRRVNPDSDDHAELERVETYVLEAGDARPYSTGMIHSTRQTEKAWVIRVTGTDLDVLPRFRFKRDRDRIVETPRVG